MSKPIELIASTKAWFVHSTKIKYDCDNYIFSGSVFGARKAGEVIKILGEHSERVD